ncbi:hypothetical protein HYH03_000605 [Edaphochlamys debaryana]|uniref:Peptidase S49 domain-containing protein n=1 Tax=Edaphochlamys debaryana TaxID=47281 RepID=A0A835YG62_9CHLO|nr:hypothetical protein HYH03_000605 [Edaphochlamys debaryana]|eukprot:KAG2502113.1 hypothetical protein HYH03_000605 [Edaphochlamys debaryana]
MSAAGPTGSVAGPASGSPSSAWATMAELGKAVKKGGGRGLALVGAGAVAGSVAMAVARYQAAKVDRSLPSEFVLELPLDRLHVVDAVDTSPLALLRGDTNQVELPKAVAALRRAAADPRCRGVVAYLGGRENLGGLATVQELREAICGFRAAVAAAVTASGRPPARTAAWAASFGEAGGSGMGAFLLASACEGVHMQPSGLLGLSGLESRAFFVRGLLDRIAAEPEFFAREEFKSAANTLTERGFTAAQRENLGALVGDMAEQMLTCMAGGRGVELAALREAVAAGPLLPGPALARRLLDGTAYRDEVQAAFAASEQALKEEKARQGRRHRRRKEDTRMARVPLDRYIRATELQAAAGAWRGHPAGWLAGTPLEPLALALRGRLQDGVAAQRSPVGPLENRLAVAGQPKVAVVTLAGTIVQGPVQPGPQQQGQSIDASKVVGQLATLLEDPDVKAVVLRINSPGGSALASDSIHHEVTRLRAAGKPVVVSMGDVAASGGYYIAAGADRVVAQPGTLTGSIGVIAGKVNVGRTLESVGVNTDAVATAPNADLLSPFSSLRPEQRAQVEAMVDSVYDDFLGKVARGRNRPLSEVRQLAKGRVYTGRQAHELGLVDELGGLDAAVRSAKQLARLPEDAAVVEHPPRRIPFLVQLLRRQAMGGGEGGGEGGAGGASLGRELLGAAASAVVAGSGAGAGMGLGAGAGGVQGMAAALAGALAAGGPQARAAALQASQAVQLLSSGEPQMYSMEAAMLASV